MKRAAVVALAFLVVAPQVALSHPHFNKTVTAKLPSGVDVTLTYNTTPSNELHAQNAKVGEFVTPRRPMLKLSGELKGATVTVPAGEYTIGVIKNGDNDFTMALYKGTPPGGGTPDMAQMIKLDSMYSKAMGPSHHLLIDITPGDGKFEGKAVLTLHFGTMYLAGALS